MTNTDQFEMEMIFQDGATFLSLPQSECQDFFTQKTNSSSASGGDSVHSELMTPPSDSHFPPNKSSSGSGLTKLSGGSGSGAYQPNWSEFFPPPPACPPSDFDSSLNTPLVNRNQHGVKVTTRTQNICQKR